jgi:hypothetical protein
MDAEEHPLLRAIVAWASDRPDVRAVVLRTSRSAAEGTSDAESDFEIDLAVADPHALDGGGWLTAIAPVLVASEDEEDGDPTHLVFFGGHRRVEFRVRRAVVAGAGTLLFERTDGDHDGAATTRASAASTVPTAADAASAADPPEDRAATDGEAAAPAPAVLRAVVPVFSGPDVPALLAHWRALGFDVARADDGTGCATRDAARLRVAADLPGRPGARGLAEVEVDDPEALARTWSGVPGGRTTGPGDGADGWAHADPAGNVLRLRPVRPD